MKKFGILALLLAACTAAQAASITWQLNTSAKVNFDSSSIGKNGSMYVVYLGTENTLASLTYADVMGKTAVGDSPYATSLGQVETKEVTVSVAESTCNPSGCENSYFAAYMQYESGGKTYINVSSTVFALTGADVNAFLTEGTAVPSSSFGFTDSKPTTSLSTTSASSGGWVAVPEPSTAALALAGLALLLKRRKA